MSYNANSSVDVLCEYRPTQLILLWVFCFYRLDIYGKAISISLSGIVCKTDSMSLNIDGTSN